ncbi:MAG: S41 family peptidase [Candidatus Eisenbacteria bacterium]
MTFGRRMIRLRRSLGYIFAFGALVILLTGQSAAQVGRDEQLAPTTPELRASIVDSVTAALNAEYVFEDVALEMEGRLRGKLRSGDYDEFETIADFARALTEDLQDVSGDRHLGVRYMSNEDVAAALEEDEDPELEQERQLERLRRDNFEFKKVEVMPGNVGYLKFNGFVHSSYSGPTATAALNFLGHTDALIVDLRENGGGSPSLIQYIMGYLLEGPTHLNSFHTRQGDSVQQFWSAPYVPGPMMDDVDLYVLTSSYTFSGAEEFTYNVKNLERGTIIGETTGGGAHPISFQFFPSLNCGVRVPYARAVNPISGTNWEGTGITPDIEVPADEALDRAYLEALTKLMGKEENEEARFQFEWAIEDLKAKLDPVEVSEGVLETYAGQYGPRRLWVEDGSLMYQRDEGQVGRATPMTDTTFRFDNLNYFRLEVVLDDSGKPVKLVGHYDNGRTDENDRTGD